MLGHMRCRSNIHTFEDEDFLKRMTQCSAVTFIIGLAATLVFAVVLAVCVPGGFDGLLVGIFSEDGRGIIDYLLWIAWVAVALVFSLAAH